MGVVGADGHGRRLVSCSTSCRHRYFRRAGGSLLPAPPSRPASSPATSRWCAWTASASRRWTPPHTRRAIEHLDRVVGGVDAIVVADYGKGFLTQPFADRICRSARDARQSAGRGPAPLHFALLARRHRHQAQPRRSFRRRRTAARRPGHAGALRPASARRRPPPARSLASRQPSDYARRARHAAAPAGRPAVPHPHARASRFRRLRRRRHGHRRFRPGPFRRGHARGSRRAGQPRQRHRGGQARHGYRQPRRTPMPAESR